MCQVLMVCTVSLLLYLSPDVSNRFYFFVGASMMGITFGTVIHYLMRSKQLNWAVQQSYSMLFEQINDGILYVDNQEQIVSANKAFLDMTGYSLSEVKGRNAASLFIPEDLKEKYDTSSIAAKRKNGESGVHMLPIQTKSKVEKWIRINGTPVYDYFGTVIGSLGIHSDMSKERESALRLEEKSAHLTKVNKELEHFAYVVSHDLQQPLRAINSFTQLLERKLIQSDDSEAKEYMRFIRDGAQSMSQYIADILYYSRTGRREMKLEALSLADLLTVIKSSFRKEIIEDSVSIDFTEEGKLFGDKILIQRLLQNLVDNAIKYKKDNLNAEVIVSFRISDTGYQELSVADNGIGIDPQYGERVFQIFQRLHVDQEKYNGSGIGLSVCKLIAERHEGEISYTANGVGGTTFKMVWPLQNDMLASPKMNTNSFKEVVINAPTDSIAPKDVPRSGPS